MAQTENRTSQAGEEWLKTPSASALAAAIKQLKQDNEQLFSEAHALPWWQVNTRQVYLQQIHRNMDRLIPLIVQHARSVLNTRGSQAHPPAEAENPA